MPTNTVPDPLFKGYGGGASSASLTLQVLYDDANRSVDKLFITNGTRNDQGFTHHFGALTTLCF